MKTQYLNKWAAEFAGVPEGDYPVATPENPCINGKIKEVHLALESAKIEWRHFRLSPGLDAWRAQDWGNPKGSWNYTIICPATLYFLRGSDGELIGQFHSLEEAKRAAEGDLSAPPDISALVGVPRVSKRGR